MEKYVKYAIVLVLVTLLFLNSECLPLADHSPGDVPPPNDAHFRQARQFGYGIPGYGYGGLGGLYGGGLRTGSSSASAAAAAASSSGSGLGYGLF